MAFPKIRPTFFDSPEEFWNDIITEHESEYAHIFTDAYNAFAKPEAHGFFEANQGHNYFISGITTDESASALLRFQPRGQTGITNASELEIYVVGPTNEEPSTPLFALVQTLDFISSRRTYLTNNDSISGRIWLANNSSRRTPTVAHKPETQHRGLVDKIYNNIRGQIESLQQVSNFLERSYHKEEQEAPGIIREPDGTTIKGISGRILKG